MPPNSRDEHDATFVPAGGGLHLNREAVEIRWTAGARIAGRYEILGLCGKGGMGTVYRVRDTALDEIVALKILRGDQTDAPAARQRFVQEARLARKVTHRNVIRTFDLGEHAGGLYLTMEFVDGISLRQLVDNEGRLTPARAVEMATAVAAGVAAAHEVGVLHRDLKPDNVLIGSDGRIAVADFGIARLQFGPSTTGLATTIGTPAYMAPEQVQSGPVDARADVYALGCILFELLTGERAWPGEDPFAVALARLQSPPPQLPDLPGISQPLRQLVHTCLAVQRNQRPASAAEVVRELRRCAALTSAESTAPAVAASAERPARAQSVAVLPLRNAGPADDDELAQGLSEELADSLSISRQLRVRPLATVRQALRPDLDPGAIGRTLQVDAVVEGSIRRNGEQLRVTARVISTHDGFQLWAQRFEVALAQALSVADAVAQAVAAALNADAPSRHATLSDPELLRDYLAAKRAIRTGLPDQLGQGVAAIEQILVRVPDDPGLLATYALAQTKLGNAAGPVAKLALDKARAAVAKALTLAPDHAEVLTASAEVRWHCHDAAGATRELLRAVRLAPSLVPAQERLASILLESGRLDEARVRYLAVLDLDPMAPVDPRFGLVTALGLAGRVAEAVAACQMPAELPLAALSTRFLRYRLVMWRLVPADPPLELPEPGPQATAMERRIFDIFGAYDRLLTTGVLSPGDEAAFAQFRFDALTPRMQALSTLLHAEALLHAGHTAAALQRVEQAVAEGLEDLAWFDHCPLLSAVRSEAPWRKLRSQVAGRAAAVLAVLG